MRQFISKFTRQSVGVAVLFMMGGPRLEVLEAEYSISCDHLDGTRGADWTILVPGHLYRAATHGAPFWIIPTLSYLSDGVPVTYVGSPYPVRANAVSGMLGDDYVFTSRTCIYGGPWMDNNSPVEVSATISALPQIQ